MTKTTNQPKTGVLIVNLGTPDSPNTPDVRKYLREFLMDARVIDIPFMARFALVNFIIAPFRAPKSAKIYQKVWEERGSPLKFYSQDLEVLLQAALGDEYIVSMGMRYQSPSIEQALSKLKDKGLEQIIVVPLFPQYASATSGSVHEKVMQLIGQWQIIPDLKLVSSFFENPLFVEAFAELGRRYKAEYNYEHYLFTYHGLPERQIHKGDMSGGKCLTNGCCDTLHAKNKLCYRAQCFATSRFLAEKLGIAPENYTVSFQSRLGKDPWIQPYTEDVIHQLRDKNIKSVLAFSPSFVADCLETTIEVGEEYREVFEHRGGEHWRLVESLNVQPLWVETLKSIVFQYENKPVAAQPTI
ncbi:ferrochelatase [Flexibacter flexilis DSM 6793]|uniref:Ferrochelatase n=1 Tax=Flexibacter flexilis DSM 6793 TaxID=927664 RepID=A0A1I1K3N0_9BACT|nr:ferrochelatase [Flexibacter flexilis]SFC52613.1 ferrochelatase [Flexibacter flexilis DSM 6793]